MKILDSLKLAIIVIALTFISCKKDDAPEVFLGKETSEFLSQGVWATTGATYESVSRTEWLSLEITFSPNETFTGGTFIISGQPNDTNANIVWPNTGTWQFDLGSDGQPIDLTKITRDDGIVLNLDIEEENNNLSISFAIPDPSGKSEGIIGDWVFSHSLK